MALVRVPESAVCLSRPYTPRPRPLPLFAGSPCRVPASQQNRCRRRCAVRAIRESCSGVGGAPAHAQGRQAWLAVRTREEPVAPGLAEHRQRIRFPADSEARHGEATQEAASSPHPRTHPPAVRNQRGRAARSRGLGEAGAAPAGPASQELRLPPPARRAPCVVCDGKPGPLGCRPAATCSPGGEGRLTSRDRAAGAGAGPWCRAGGTRHAQARDAER